jgi:hypothetical protein
MPAIIRARGERANRFIEFYTASIRNRNTRMAFNVCTCGCMRPKASCLRPHLGLIRQLKSCFKYEVRPCPALFIADNE